MNDELRVLIVEDSEQDAALLIRKLKEAGYTPINIRVDTYEAMKSALEQKNWDIVLSDYVMPSFSGLEAFKLLQQTGIDVPFIVVSGQIGEDVAVEAMRSGASDYIMKGNLKRLGAAIARELIESENRHQRRIAEKELAKSEVELRMLSHRLIKMQEDERRTLARELHDEIGHTLAYLRLMVDKASQLTPDKATETLNESKNILSGLIEQVRNLSLSLKPPMLEEDGLLQAIKYLTERYNRETQLKIDLSSSNIPEKLEWDTSLTAYRIVQESLTNVIKHAKAAEVHINLYLINNTINIRVKDNGVGFITSRTNGGAGLRGMQERANLMGGTLKIESKPGIGTTIDAAIPVYEDTKPA